MEHHEQMLDARRTAAGQIWEAVRGYIGSTDPDDKDLEHVARAFHMTVEEVRAGRMIDIAPAWTELTDAQRDSFTFSGQIAEIGQLVLDGMTSTMYPKSVTSLDDLVDAIMDQFIPEGYVVIDLPMHEHKEN